MVVATLLLKMYDFKILKTRNTEKLLLLLVSAIMYFEVGERIGIASLLGVMTIGYILLEKREQSALQFSAKLAKVWVFAQVVLFTLVGTEVNVEVAIKAGLLGIIVIAIGLVGRSVGVWIATLGTNLSTKERLFCMIAYTPKATVQAAIGSIPLAAGTEAGGIILEIEVLSISLTAPLGALGTKMTAPTLLNKVEKE